MIQGDLNDEPDADFIQELRQEYKNAYVEATGEQPPFSTHKHREHGLESRVIDYMFYTGLDIVGVLKMPKLEDIPETACPNA